MTLLTQLLTGIGLSILSVTPALAVGDDPVVVPEPTTLSLLAGAVVAGVVVHRLRKRK